jgi:hypothetical protein
LSSSGVNCLKWNSGMSCFFLSLAFFFISHPFQTVSAHIADA